MYALSEDHSVGSIGGKEGGSLIGVNGGLSNNKSFDGMNFPF